MQPARSSMRLNYSLLQGKASKDRRLRTYLMSWDWWQNRAGGEKKQAQMATSGKQLQGEGSKYQEFKYQAEQRHSTLPPQRDEPQPGQLGEVHPRGTIGSRMQRTHTSGQASIQPALILQGQSWLEIKSALSLVPWVTMTMFSIKAGRHYKRT